MKDLVIVRTASTKVCAGIATGVAIINPTPKQMIIMMMMFNKKGAREDSFFLGIYLCSRWNLNSSSSITSPNSGR